jgi:hypothetical protein
MAGAGLESAPLGFVVAAGAVALPVPGARGVWQANGNAAEGYFAKQGTYFAIPGLPASIRVLPANGNPTTLSWGLASKEATSIVLGSCPNWTNQKPWIAFPGGIFVRRRACVTLVVRSRLGVQRVRVPVGTPCPAPR